VLLARKLGEHFASILLGRVKLQYEQGGKIHIAA
jgi:hypothetical protein